jgi:hypothetical protein
VARNAPLEAIRQLRSNRLALPQSVPCAAGTHFDLAAAQFAGLFSGKDGAAALSSFEAKSATLTMMGDRENLTVMASGKPKPRWPIAVAWLLAGLLPAAVAFAQDAQQPPGAGQFPQPQAPASVPAHGQFPDQPPPSEKPGFIYEFGRWWDTTRGKFDEIGKQSDAAAKGAATATQGAVQGAADATKGAATATENAVKGAAEATKNAATTIFRLPGMRVVEVHQLCSVAPNGAPDCRAAAAAACRTKGFTSGNPVDVRSSQNCPPAVWLSGRSPSTAECPEETVVLMAACQ